MGRRRNRLGTGVQRIAPKLYHAPPLLNDIEAILSGRPDRMLRRLLNKLVGRWPFSPRRCPGGQGRGASRPGAKG
jgi:hypothetical protein